MTNSYSFLRTVRWRDPGTLLTLWFVFGSGLTVGAAAPSAVDLFILASVGLLAGLVLYLVYLLARFHREFGLATVFGGDSDG